MNVSENPLAHSLTHLSVVHSSEGVRSIIVHSHHEEATRMSLGSLLKSSCSWGNDSVAKVDCFLRRKVSAGAPNQVLFLPAKYEGH